MTPDPADFSTRDLFLETMFGQNRDSAYASSDYPRGASLFVVLNVQTCYGAGAMQYGG